MSNTGGQASVGQNAQSVLARKPSSVRWVYLNLTQSICEYVNSDLVMVNVGDRKRFWPVKTCFFPTANSANVYKANLL